MRRILVFALSVALAAAALLAGPQAANAAGIASRLANAIVPSMCDFPAGRLVNGSLPGAAPGNVDLDRKLTRTGNLVKGAGTGAAAVFHCSQGGVGWPDHVVFYDRNLAVIGHFDSYSIGVYSGRAVVRSVSIHKRTVTIRVVAVGQPGDNDLWGSSGAKVTYAWDSKKKSMTRRSATIYRERNTAKKIVKLVFAGKFKAARKYVDAATLKQLKVALRPATKSWRPKAVRVTSCYGTFSDDYLGEFIQYSQRGCMVDLIWGDGYSTFLLTLDHPAKDANWTRWRGVGFVGIAG